MMTFSEQVMQYWRFATGHPGETAWAVSLGMLMGAALLLIIFGVFKPYTTRYVSAAERNEAIRRVLGERTGRVLHEEDRDV